MSIKTIHVFSWLVRVWANEYCYMSIKGKHETLTEQRAIERAREMIDNEITFAGEE